MKVMDEFLATLDELILRVAKPKALTLGYEVVDEDLAREAPRFDRYGFRKPRTKTLIWFEDPDRPQDPPFLFIHGNNRITVKEGAKDVGASFFPVRIRREWDFATDPSNRDEHLKAGDYGMPNGWALDGKGEQHIWIDIPGYLVADRPAAASCSLHEYAVGVKGRADAGAVYFHIIVDTTPQEYRIRMSPKAVKVPAEKWRDWQKAPIEQGQLGPMVKKPWKTEAEMGVTAPYGGWVNWEAELAKLVITPPPQPPP
jgi:hypothetical protein